MQVSHYLSKGILGPPAPFSRGKAAAETTRCLKVQRKTKTQKNWTRIDCAVKCSVRNIKLVRIYKQNAVAANGTTLRVVLKVGKVSSYRNMCRVALCNDENWAVGKYTEKKSIFLMNQLYYSNVIAMQQHRLLEAIILIITVRSQLKASIARMFHRYRSDWNLKYRVGVCDMYLLYKTHFYIYSKALTHNYLCIILVGPQSDIYREIRLFMTSCIMCTSPMRIMRWIQGHKISVF